MKKVFLYSSFMMILLSCENSASLGDNYDQSKYKGDVDGLVKKKEISEGDRGILISYITEFKDSISNTISYENLLANAKLYNSRKLEQEKKKEELTKAMTVKVLRKYMEPMMDEGYVKNFLLISVKCSNNTSNKVSGFGVDIIFTNKSGEIIYSANWPVDKTVNPNSSIVIPLSTGEYENTNEEQSKLKMSDLSKLTVTTNVTYLTYDDGTTLKL